MHVLLLFYTCNPDQPSLPGEAYEYYRAIRDRVRVTLVTSSKNRPPLTGHGHTGDDIIYIPESKLAARYYRLFVARRRASDRNWPLINLLTYPIYQEFNHRAYRLMARDVRAGRFDVVHAFTPVTPRYAYRLADACDDTPFILGPLNGGLDYPEGFKRLSRREGGYLRFLRRGARLAPGYRRTYRQAARILAGSDHALTLLREMFPRHAERIDLFYEHGIPDSFIGTTRSWQGQTLKLLYVGRLVPLKGVDMLIDMVARLDEAHRQRIELTIVGDGPERAALEVQADALGLTDRVRFVGHVPHADMPDFYQQADLFCFPSVREFGGIVVLEAMAAGLPCIVIDYGGPGSVVTEAVGFKIAPTSRAPVIQRMQEIITGMLEDRYDYARLSERAIEQARHYTWPRKGDALVKVYHDVLKNGPQS